MNINSLKHCAALGMIVIGASLSLPAVAQSHGGGHSGGGVHSGSAGGGHGGGGWHGGGWHGGGGWRGPGWWGVGLGLGLGWDALYFGYPNYDYPYPGYYYPYSPPTVIVEPSAPPQGTEAPQNPPPAANWYYCESAKAYYPYVRQCPEAWHVVPATPSGSVR